MNRRNRITNQMSIAKGFGIERRDASQRGWLAWWACLLEQEFYGERATRGSNAVMMLPFEAPAWHSAGRSSACSGG